MERDLYYPRTILVDLFATYAYHCRICPMEFFIEFRPKDNKQFQREKCDSYTRMLQINPPLEWNKLPREIVLSTSLAALKNAIFNISDFLLFGVFVTVIAIAF